MKGMGELMQQAQQMQEGMQKAQEELAATEVEGQAGGGMVSIRMTCKHDVREVKIEPELLRDSQDMLEDLVAAAVNDANRKVERTVKDKLSSVTGGLPLPEGMNLPLG